MDTITEWYERYGEDVYNFLIYRTGSSNVEDLVQETFIRALKSFKTYHGKSSPIYWLFSIAKYVAIDSMRKARRDTPVKGEVLENIPDSHQPPDRVSELNDTQQRLWEVISALKPRSYRDVVVCRGILDYSVSEAARALGWTEIRVRVTWHRALKKLRSELEGMGITYERLS